MTDFISVPGVIAALDLKIPYVINAPALVDFAQDFNIMPAFNYKRNARMCCGTICITQSIKTFALKKVARIESLSNPYKVRYSKVLHESVIMLNSFWGLDSAISLPPNNIVTGPLSIP